MSPGTRERVIKKKKRKKHQRQKKKKENKKNRMGETGIEGRIMNWLYWPVHWANITAKSNGTGIRNQ